MGYTWWDLNISFKSNSFRDTFVQNSFPQIFTRAKVMRKVIYSSTSVKTPSATSGGWEGGLVTRRDVALSRLIIGALWGAAATLAFAKHDKSALPAKYCLRVCSKFMARKRCLKRSRSKKVYLNIFYHLVWQHLSIFLYFITVHNVFNLKTSLNILIRIHKLHDVYQNKNIYRIFKLIFRGFYQHDFS